MILVDATPLVALCDPRDRLHRRALADLDRVGRRGLALPEPVLTEACFLLDHAILRARLERVIVELSIVPWCPVDAGAFRLEAFAWLRRYAEHAPDWADATLAVASAHETKARVWTYDAEFRTTWRRPGGARIPLVRR